MTDSNPISPGDRANEEPLATPLTIYRPAAAETTVPAGAMCRFADRVSSVAAGFSAICEVMDCQENDRPVLGGFHRAALLGLMRETSLMLSEEAHTLVDWAYDEHTPEGQRAKLDQALKHAQLKGVIPPSAQH